VVDGLDVRGNSAPVGVSVFHAAGDVDLHDVVVHQPGASLGVSLEARPGAGPSTVARNVWVEDTYDGLRLAPSFTSTARCASRTPRW
jgi:hypothetical protein